MIHPTTHSQDRQQTLLLLAWNAILAASLALLSSVILQGRTLPTQATAGWVASFAIVFMASMGWLTTFSSRLGAKASAKRYWRLCATVAVESPLLALCILGSTVLYLSDDIYHLFSFYLQPAPAVILLLVVLTTVVFQEAALQSIANRGVARAIAHSRRWALPMSLLLLGLLQGASQLWIIGNDFNRYWAVADAIASWSGYPASIHLPSYIEGGMYRYSIEFPVFPLLLLTSFTVFGHDTVGGHMPALVANTLLPLIVYGLYRKAGVGRALAFSGSCVVVIFPFFRLYTLNAPVPDAVFTTLLVATGYAALRITGGLDLQTPNKPQGDAARSETYRMPLLLGRLSVDATEKLRPWVALGLLAGLTTLTRAEGLLFMAMIAVAFLPYLRHRGPYVAAAIFLAMAIPFSLLMMSTFGIPWPRNAGTSFDLHHMVENLDWLERISLRWYAGAFGLSESSFVFLTQLLVATILAGTAYLAVQRWQLTVYPLAGVIHTIVIFTIDPVVAGADQWFDFFRHISYGIPFMMLPILCTITSLSHKFRSVRLQPARVVALCLLLFSAYQLYLLARPSQTFGGNAGQLLTSDIWVSIADIFAHPYPLPTLPFEKVEGISMIAPGFSYMDEHLELVKAFYEPYSALNTGHSGQYQLSSALVLAFGAVFALGANTQKE